MRLYFSVFPRWEILQLQRRDDEAVRRARGRVRTST